MVNDRLATALSHDTREHALAMCSVRPTSTKEVAEALDISVSAAWYHVDKLRELGCIEEVDARPRRGAIERFYVATAASYFDSAAWEQVPDELRSRITMRILRLIARDVDEAVRAKTIEEADSHLSRITIDLDAPGRQEAYVVLGHALKELMTVRENCAARTDQGPEGTIPTSFVLMQLERSARTTLT